MKKWIITIVLAWGLIPTGNAQCSQHVLQAFGGTSSIALYNTYLAIGAIADGFVAEAYEGSYVVSLMNEQSSMLEVVKAQLQGALDDKKSGMSEDDNAYLRQMITTLDHLRLEAEGLSKYAVDGSQEADKQYNDNRTKAWDLISEMLGLSE